MIELAEESKGHQLPDCGVSIKVIGVGGAGGNTVNSIVASGYKGIECIAANTDAQALNISQATEVVQLGVKSTKGLGTGADPEIGRRAAEEDLDKVLDVIGEADIVFLVAGMGGGTGSGGLPVIAHALREKGILSIAIVTKPFQFEGKRRMRVAQESIECLAQEVDALLMIPNQRLLEVVDEGVSMIDAFAMINDVLGQSVRGISDIIARPGHINVDFADVRAIMKDCGLAVMGTGKASGDGRAKQAALQAISSPLLENMNVEGAHGVLLNITGGKNLSLYEVSEAASVVYEQAHDDANIIIGSVVDESLEDEVIVTVIATGFSRCAVPENMRRLTRPAVADVEKAAAMQAECPTTECPELDEAPKDETACVPEDGCAETDTQTEDAIAEAATESTTETDDSLEAAADAQETAQEKSLIITSETDVSGAECKLVNPGSVDPNDLDIPTFLREQATKE